jgi:xanthine/CO dehydrogenase XdhC/CoxF family maturation factor
MSDSGELPGSQPSAAAHAGAAATVADPHEHEHVHDASCAVAHGHEHVPVTATRTLVAVFDSPVARFLLAYARDAGYRPVLLDPDPGRRGEAKDGVSFVRAFDGEVDEATDVVVCDHHRPELGMVLRDALASPARWVGVMGNPRHRGPHIEALAALGVPPEEVARVHRPIGLNIGSRTPAEIALSTMAGLIADRNQRAGGFTF